MCPCGRTTLEPRNGQCGRCYQHAYHGRRLAAACEGCNETDARTLVRRTLSGVAVTLCGNCAAIVGRRPLSLEALRAEVGPSPGDRRSQERRRAGDRRRSGLGWSGVTVPPDDRRDGPPRGRRQADRVRSWA
jgi:hypothetical protein